MAEPKLILAPHELEPNRHEDWDGEPFVFRANWCGVERDFVGQVVGQRYTPMIFFALADEPDRGNFVSAIVWKSKHPDHTPTPTFEPRSEMIPLHPQDLIRHLELATDEGWGRLYFVDEKLEPVENQPAHWRLFLAQSGWGQWSAAPDFYSHNARFRWNENPHKARELALLPPLELLEQLRPSLLDSQSDAAFARLFIPLKAKARHQQCRPLQRGSYNEWQQSLQRYLQSRIALWKSDKATVSLRVHNPTDEEDRCTSKGDARQCSQTDARFFDWTRQYFAPTLDEDLLKRCSAAAAWSRRSFTVSASAKRPTQHERLEALLQLRDWLGDKATPEEIELLLYDD